MSYQVLVSRTFQGWFDDLDDEARERVRSALEALEEDPRQPRSGADIRRLENTDPTKHRIRVGPWRVVYLVDDGEQEVRVIDGFRRGHGYR